MVQKKILVLGAGLIGKAIAIDLCKKFEVTCADMQMCSLETLSPKFPIHVIPINFKNDSELTQLIKQFDLVVSAVPGSMGFNILKKIIEAKKDVVDISFFPEDPFELDELAKKNNVTAVVDCGVAPGLCNIIAGFHYSQGKLKRYECMVGGLPVDREWPFEYKAVFSPADVIEEYTRPARFIENGKPIIKEALSEIEKIEFDEIGELESFNTDGLRTLAETMSDVPNMKEKTLRFPGHAELMRVFRETGLFSKTPMAISGTLITPLELTSKLLFSKWKMKTGGEDFTIMKVLFETDVELFTYSLYDRYDKNSNTSSMARTTGYTCTAVVNLIADGAFLRKGICPPEYIGAEKGCFEKVMNYLNQRNVNCEKQVRHTKKSILI